MPAARRAKSAKLNSATQIVRLRWLLVNARKCSTGSASINRQQSFVLTPDHAIPEAAARVHNLRNMGFNITTTILPEVEFRGLIRRNAALYSLGSPEWPRPGFSENEEVGE